MKRNTGSGLGRLQRPAYSRNGPLQDARRNPGSSTAGNPVRRPRRCSTKKCILITMASSSGTTNRMRWLLHRHTPNQGLHRLCPAAARSNSTGPEHSIPQEPPGLFKPVATNSTPPASRTGKANAIAPGRYLLAATGLNTTATPSSALFGGDRIARSANSTRAAMAKATHPWAGGHQGPISSSKRRHPGPRPGPSRWNGNGERIQPGSISADAGILVNKR